MQHARTAFADDEESGMTRQFWGAMTRRCLGAALAGVIIATPALAQESEESWKGMKFDIFRDKPIADGADLLEMDAPMRAEDAAVVPITVRALKPQSGETAIKTITLVVDENPAPVAATVTFGPAAATASFSTRLRVNSYSYIRAIAEMEDGSLRMIKKYVKASGGCSAPALKDQDKSVSELGQLRLRQFVQGDAEAKEYALTPKDVPAIEAQILVRHPNYSGLQMDQLSMLYIPAHYVREIEVKRGDSLIFKMEGGISLSENPGFRFAFRKDGDGHLSLKAEDTKQNVFQKSWPVERVGS
jgi:sulfur-oxidizing protein SoxY